jgi:hypothetical protein
MHAGIEGVTFYARMHQIAAAQKQHNATKMSSIGHVFSKLGLGKHHQHTTPL